MKDFLKEIIAKKKQRLAQRKQEFPQENLLARIESLGQLESSFSKSINRPRHISLIAEIKKASPSRGIIRQDFDPLQIAKFYKQAGAQAISVLTCEDYFFGDISYVEQINKESELPILRKDFIIEPYQIYESRAFGCQAILLIASLLSQDSLSEFISLAGNLGLDCLVEVHTEKDLKKALRLKSNLIGINNRDLNTLQIDSKTTERLYPLIPKGKIVVVESGIKSYQDILFLKVLGVAAALIGEAFMEAEDIENRVKDVMGW